MPYNFGPNFYFYFFCLVSEIPIVSTKNYLHKHSSKPTPLNRTHSGQTSRRTFSKPKTVAGVGETLRQPTGVVEPLKSTLYFLFRRVPRWLPGRNIHVGIDEPRGSLGLIQRSELGDGVEAVKGGCRGGGSPVEISGPQKKMILKLEVLMILLV